VVIDKTWCHLESTSYCTYKDWYEYCSRRSEQKTRICVLHNYCVIAWMQLLLSWTTLVVHSRDVENCGGVSPWRMHCMHSGMAKDTSDVEQQKNQARSLSHCWVTWVWRHQAVSHAVENSIKSRPSFVSHSFFHHEKCRLHVMASICYGNRP